MIDSNVDFYMLGLKPNSSRLSVKFIIRRKYADVLWNIAKFQKDLQVTEDFHSVALWQIKREMISPKSKNDKVNSAVMSRSVSYTHLDVYKRQVRILAEIRNNPNITKARLMELLGLGKTTIDRGVSVLKKYGYIERVGSRKAGYWKVHED